MFNKFNGVTLSQVPGFFSKRFTKVKLGVLQGFSTTKGIPAQALSLSQMCWLYLLQLDTVTGCLMLNPVTE